jgi:hypothetical protein
MHGTSKERLIGPPTSSATGGNGSHNIPLSGNCPSLKQRSSAHKSRSHIPCALGFLDINVITWANHFNCGVWSDLYGFKANSSLLGDEKSSACLAVHDLHDLHLTDAGSDVMSRGMGKHRGGSCPAVVDTLGRSNESLVAKD